MSLLATTMAAAVALLGTPDRAAAGRQDGVIARPLAISPAIALRALVPAAGTMERVQPARGVAVAAVWALTTLDGRLPGDGDAASGIFRDVIFRNRALVPMAWFCRRGIAAGLSVRF